MSDDVEDLARKLSEWHADSWKRFIDPRSRYNGELTIYWFGGRYYWYVTKETPPPDDDSLPKKIELGKGICETLEDAQRAAESVWLEKSPGARETEIAAVEARIEREQRALAALRSVPLLPAQPSASRDAPKEKT